MKKDFKDFTLGLSFINKIKPQLFKLKAPSEFPTEWDSYNSKETEPIYGGYIAGIIAQQVKKAMEECDVDIFSGWDILPDGKQQISFEAFVLPLINAVNELSKEIEILKGNKKLKRK